MKDILDYRIVISKEILHNQVADERVFLNLENETYYGLDSVGVRIWELIEEDGDLQRIYETLLEEYDVEADQLETDLDKFINQLVKNGLISLIKKDDS